MTALSEATGAPALARAGAILGELDVLAAAERDLRAELAGLLSGSGNSLPGPDQDRLTLKRAAAMAGKTETTVSRWCDRFGLGRKVGGGWVVSRSKFVAFLHDRTTA